MSLLTELKSSTRSEHDSIERSLNLLDPEMSLEKYQDILKRFFGFYASVEPELGRYPAVMGEDHLKTPVLKRDLLYFRVDPDSVKKLPTESFTVKNIEEAIGMLYVLEGSSLGAQVLSRHFERELKVSPGKGLDFFSGHGAETMPRWLRFKEKLETLGSELDHSRIIVSAKKTFNLLENWLTSTL